MYAWDLRADSATCIQHKQEDRLGTGEKVTYRRQEEKPGRKKKKKE